MDKRRISFSMEIFYQNEKEKVHIGTCTVVLCESLIREEYTLPSTMEEWQSLCTVLRNPKYLSN